MSNRDSWTLAMPQSASSTRPRSRRRRAARIASTSRSFSTGSRRERRRSTTSTCARSSTTRASSAPGRRVRGKLAPATISRKLAAVRAFLRHSLGAARVPDARLAPRRGRRLPDAPRRADVDKELAALEGEGPLPLRNRALVELVYSAGLRSAEAVGLDLGDVDFEQELVHVRSGKGGKDRVIPLGEEAAHWVARYLARRAPGARARRERRALRLGDRQAPRHEHAAAARPAPAPAASRIRDAPARGRRRPPHDPGAARSQLALDDAGLLPRRRAAAAEGLRLVAPAFLTQPVRSAGCETPRAERGPTMDSCRRLLPRALDRAACAADGRRLPARPRRLRDLARRLAGGCDAGAARRLRRAAPRRRARGDDDRATRRRAPVVLPPPGAARRARRTTPPPSSSCRAGAARCRRRSRPARSSG